MDDNKDTSIEIKDNKIIECNFGTGWSQNDKKKDKKDKSKK